MNPFDLPDITDREIVDKIEALTNSIRGDWSDPRSECREIWKLCARLRTGIENTEIGKIL